MHKDTKLKIKIFLYLFYLQPHQLHPQDSSFFRNVVEEQDSHFFGLHLHSFVAPHLSHIHIAIIQ